MQLRNSAVIGLAAVGLSLGLVGTARADVLPVTDLQFNTFNGTFDAPKDTFTSARPTGWSIGSVAQYNNLIFVGNQGSEGSSANGTYGVYGTFSDTVPAGYNFYQADGNPQYESTIKQTISGLRRAQRTPCSSSRPRASRLNLAAPPLSSGWSFSARVGSASIARITAILARSPVPTTISRKIHH